MGAAKWGEAQKNGQQNQVVCCPLSDLTVLFYLNEQIYREYDINFSTGSINTKTHEYVAPTTAPTEPTTQYIEPTTEQESTEPDTDPPAEDNYPDNPI